MQFVLPEHLKVAVAAYDPTLKVLAKQQAKTSNPRKATFNLGLPDDLVPHDLISKDDQVEIAKDMHGKEAANRVTTIQPPNKQAIVCISHHRSVWLAVWVDHSQSEYIYGFSYAYKAAPSVSSKVDPILIRSEYGYREYLREREVSVKYGRIEFMRYSAVITLDQIKDGFSLLPWDCLIDRWSKAGHTKWQVFQQLVNKGIKPQVITFDDQHVFARLRAIAKPAHFMWGNNTINADVTIDSLAGAASLPRHIAETPFFRNEIFLAAAEFNARLNNPAVRETSEVKSSVKHFLHRTEWVKRFLSIYPDAQIDYVQQLYVACGCINLSWYLTTERVNPWLRDNMPVASFVRICRTFADSITLKLTECTSEEADRMIRSATSYGDGFPTWRNNTFDDALNVLDTVLKGIQDNPDCDIKLERPDRWRVSEFHDYLVSLSFKINNTNDPLPQHLFPEPLKIHDAEGKKWTFFQPADVHQLASWGQAVRNCVGSASAYRDGIKKKTHFIILAMIDNKPQFTIQARVNNGIFDVSQIAGIANRSLTDIERSTYQTVFAEAINKQNEIFARCAA